MKRSRSVLGGRGAAAGEDARPGSGFGFGIRWLGFGFVFDSGSSWPSGSGAGPGSIAITIVRPCGVGVDFFSVVGQVDVHGIHVWLAREIN